MHELQQILLQKLPRLGELTFWCEMLFAHPKHIEMIYWKVLQAYSGELFVYYEYPTGEDVVRIDTDTNFEILGHPFTHADILEALGEDWAMTSQYWFFRKRDCSITCNEDVIFNIDFFLPSNISDLSLPEYEETRKQLIQLLTK